MKISVCVATYNGEKYIKEQLASILVQLGCDDEVIVSDDNSIDNTLSIIKTFNDNRIKIFLNNGKRGVISNFENAICHASGEFLFLCDQDDIWKLNKVESVVNLLHDYTLIVHNTMLIDGYGDTMNQDFFSLKNSKSGYWNNMIKNSYLGCCIAFRRDLLQYVIPFPKKIEMHDRWIGLQAERHGEVFFYKEILSCYRIHGGNVSNSTEKSTNSIWRMIKIRLWLFFYTVVRK